VKRLPLLAGLALLVACGQPAPTTNAVAQELQLADRTAGVRSSMNPCIIDEGDNRRFRHYRDCVDLLPQERMQGVWYQGFDESGFVPNATTAPAGRIMGIHWVNPEFHTFLEADREAEPHLPPPARFDSMTNAWLIDFVGRRAKHPGHYYAGQWGDDHNLVVLDRLISIRLLGPVVTRLDPAGCNGHCPPPLNEQ
jgi:hypothetical protein